ncbi:MAG: glutamate-1-semialdehyde 2,1-aminomutase [Aquificota bacterium]|nr:glutamate-1-semialdehyde 2,1-aminomutase [Aquificota bacterium]
MGNREIFRKALSVLPGGVNSPVRAFKAVGGDPVVLVKGEGPKVWDADGKEYIDFLASWGPLILGHGHPRVMSYIREALNRGLSFGLTNPYEVKMGEIVVESVPSVDRVRFVSSGTEATMSAVRLARGFTGRRFVVKFEGCYHGHYDGLLVSAGSGVATFGIPGTPGIPEETARTTLVVPFNDEEAVKEVFLRYGEDIACVIVEPVAGNMGVVPPKEGFLKLLRDITERSGALLIFDEVITGFRVSLGGAQELYSVYPDITCLGKVLGGGMPVGAYGGREDIMSKIAPEGPVYQAGTLSGNPVTMASGLATLEELKEKKPYRTLDERTRRLAEGVSGVLSAKGIPHRINRVGSMMTVFFTDREVLDFGSAKTSDTEMFSRFFRSLLKKGVLIPPSQFEAWFVSTAHTEEVIDEALTRIEDAVRNL